nr:phospholipase-like protein [Tanacetum cinerariifolium]
MELVSDETEIVPLYYHMFDNFQIPFEREEFCLVTGLKFGVEYWAEYDDEDESIPFRRWVFPSSLDGILQLVLLGVEDRRAVPDWILSLANNRDDWDKYHWGSYVWLTLYYQIRDANTKRWPSLYAIEPINEVDKKTYSIFEFTWAFKSPYMHLPPTMVLPKKRVDKTKKKCKNDNVSPLNLRNAFAVDNPYQEGWLSEDQMNAWIELLIRSKPQNANWTVSKSGTSCVHLGNNRFMIQTDPHIIGTLDGSTHPYPS